MSNLQYAWTSPFGRKSSIGKMHFACGLEKTKEKRTEPEGGFDASLQFFGLIKWPPVF
jgi:hypothetical protein